MAMFSLSEVIEEAVQTEKLGYQFYTEMSKKFIENVRLKELFDTLALKEQGHEKKFSDLKEKVSGEERVDWEEVSKYLRAIVESEFFLGKGKSLPSMENVKTVADAVKLALGFEKQTLLYFHAIRDAVKEKSVVDEIIAEERSHIVWLSDFQSAAK
jgi:rubrerythrin